MDVFIVCFRWYQFCWCVSCWLFCITGVGSWCCWFLFYNARWNMNHAAMVAIAMKTHVVKLVYVVVTLVGSTIALHWPMIRIHLHTSYQHVVATPSQFNIGLRSTHRIMSTTSLSILCTSSLRSIALYKNTKFATRLHSSPERFAMRGMRSRRRCMVYVPTIVSSCTTSPVPLHSWAQCFQCLGLGAASGEN